MNITREQLGRTVVACDPAVTSGEEADDSGIIVVARGPHQPETCDLDSCPGHGYVLADKTCHLPPAQLSRTIIATYDEAQADRVVAEANNGGDYIGAMIHAIRADIPYSKVTATRGKQTRAEPASALYEQGRVHHVGGADPGEPFPELAAEMETWTPDASWSPNRLDALVWGLTALGLIGAQGAAFMAAWSKEIEKHPSGPRPLPIPELHPADEQTVCKCKAPRYRETADSIRCVFCGGEKA